MNKNLLRLMAGLLAPGAFTTRIFAAPVLLAIAVFLAVAVSQAAAPQLGISLSGPGQVTLAWQGTNNWLQTSAVLPVWVNVAPPPAVAGGTNTLTLPAGQPAAFYRLVNSPYLPPPTELAVHTLSDANGDYFFELNWDAVPGAVAYNVYMAAAPGVTQSNYNTLPSGQMITGITNIYASIPDVPDMIFLPMLAPSVGYSFVVTAVTATSLQSADSNEGSGIYGQSAGVNGQVYTQVLLASNVTQVYLPGIQLSLVNPTNPLFSSTVNSDVNGEFSFPPQPAGTYQLCWQASGFVSGCLTQSITLSNLAVDLNPIQLYADTTTNGLVYGQVTFADGEPTMQYDSFYGINANAAVTLRDANGHRLRTVAPNSDGVYVMAGIPTASQLLLNATIEKANSGTNSINTFITGEADLVISNSPPTIQSVEATLNGQPIYRVTPGTTVQATVTASDPDMDALTYAWFTPAGPAPVPASSNISWTIPSDAVGFQYLFVRVSDGYGGYDVARLTLTTDPYLVFNGQVTGSDLQVGPDGAGGFLTNAPPVTNALVQLNNMVTNTDANGYFSFDVSPTNEYDLYISATGYMPLFKVWLNETPDYEYRLLQLSPATNANCVDNYPLPTSVTNANGVIVTVPPGALVDAFNNPYTGCFRATMDTLDPCDPANSFPGGNYDTAGNLLDTYALVVINLWDLAGNLLNLNPTSSVSLFLPIGSSCTEATNPPPTADFFTVSSMGGARWTNLLPGTLATNVIGSVTNIGYQGEGPLVGMLALADAQPPVDVWMLGDATLHVPFRVMIYNDTGGAKPGGLVKTEDIDYKTVTQNKPINTMPTVDGQDGRLVKGLPAGKLWVNVLDLRQAPGAFYDQWAKGKAAMPDASKTVIQTIKFDSTVTKVVIAGLGISPDPVNQPRSAQLKEMAFGARKQLFTVAAVNGYWEEFLTRTGDGSAAGATAYYKLIDPKNKKTTFADWQTANNWGVTGIGKGDDAYAVYFNSTDLGAGRRMGMKVNGQNVAYYVATYASLKSAEDDAVKGLQPGDVNSELKYIVCMEYTPDVDVNGNPLNPLIRHVKFYAYDDKGKEVNGVADEDRHRPLYVPNVCMNCHGGGSYDTAAAPLAPDLNDINAQFIAFDTANYTFSLAKNYTRDDLATVFTKLNNNLIASVPNPPRLLTQLLGLLVPGDKNYTTAAPQVAPSVWGANADLYNKVYAVSCRSCHANQGQASRWATGARLNGTSRVFMPHAQRTFSIYYGSATADKLVNGGGANSQPQIHLGAAPTFQP